MGYAFQVTVDAQDPHVLAQWWAETLGWEVERTDPEFVRDMVDQGRADESDTRQFDGALVWKAGAAITDPTTPDRPRVLFQLVPESKSVKNRMHLDVRVGDDRRAVADRLVARGATFLHDGRQGPFEWITLADPEKNEFCVT
ncbi:VOC family protein [Actinomycetes bacterium M1A6_2h]